MMSEGFELREINIEDLPVVVEPKDEDKPDKPDKPKPKTPKRRRPKWAPVKYHKHPMSKQLNSAAAGLINNTLLKQYKKKIDDNDLMLGDAIVYTVDYYLAWLPIDHPAWIMMAAMLGTMSLINECQKEGEDPTRAHPSEDVATQLDEPGMQPI